MTLLYSGSLFLWLPIGQIPFPMTSHWTDSFSYDFPLDRFLFLWLPTAQWVPFTMNCPYIWSLFLCLFPLHILSLFLTPPLWVPFPITTAQWVPFPDSTSAQWVPFPITTAQWIPIPITTAQWVPFPITSPSAQWVPFPDSTTVGPFSYNFP